MDLFLISDKLYKINECNKKLVLIWMIRFGVYGKVNVPLPY